MNSKAPPTNQQQVAAIYVRVSGHSGEDGTSLQSQEEGCRKYAAEHGYIVNEEHVFREVQSGSDTEDRPKFQTIVELVRQKVVTVVVAFNSDRLSRDPVHTLWHMDRMDRVGGRVEFVIETVDGSIEGQLITFARGWMAKLERLKIRERTQRGKHTRAKNGLIQRAGFDLYGYRRDHEANVRVVFVDEAEVVRQIFGWVAKDQMPIRAIVRQLREAEIPPPSVGKIVLDRTPRWGKSTVHRILRETAYKGEAWAWKWQSNGKHQAVTFRPETEWIRLPDSTTPALVSPETWQAAQQRLATNTGQAGRNEARQYLLRGLVWCGVCGKRMYATPEKSRRTYRCSSRETASGACGGQRLNADLVEQDVWDQLADMLRHPELVINELQRRRDRGPDKAILAQVETAKKAITKLEAEQSRYLSLFGRGLLPMEKLEAEVARVQEAMTASRASMLAAEATLSEQQQDLAGLDDLHAYCARVTANLDRFGFDDKRLALEAISARITGSGQDWSLAGRIPGQNEGVPSITR